jgi:copper chaperone CopZ
MHCAGCEIEIEKALEVVPGVREVHADHESGLVRVTLDDAASREALVGAVREALHGVGRSIDGEAPSTGAK